MLSVVENYHRIREGDAVVAYEGFQHKKHIVVRKGHTFGTPYGSYSHDDIIGRTYGEPVKARHNRRKKKGKPERTGLPDPTAYLLRPTSELWTGCLEHRTQILYTPDIAFIILQLNIQPGSIVVEAGTGSGSLSTAIARSLAPTGHLFTFDFHAERPHKARQEFNANGIGHLITVTQRDACAPSQPIAEGTPTQNPRRDLIDRSEAPDVQSVGDSSRGISTAPWIVGPSGFGLPVNSVDALFLDLPAPHTALQNVLNVLRPNGAFCSFCPCIEQTQKTCEALRAVGFVDVRTFEVLQHQHELKVQNFQHPEGAEKPSARTLQRLKKDVGETASPTKKEQETEAGKKPQKRRRGGGGSDDDDDSDEDTLPVGLLLTKPVAFQRGHTGYLTFARLMPTLPKLGVALEAKAEGASA